MSLEVMLVVLFAAALHAGWNALVKAGRDKLLETALLAVAAGVLALAAVPWLAAPASASWGFLAASVALHCLYFCLVAFAYRAGDMSLAYPLMRGSAPLMTAAVAAALLGEYLGAAGWTGIALLCAGILWLALDHRRAPRAQGRVIPLSIGNAVVVAAYTLVDGMGSRASGDPWSYVLWMFLLNAFPLLAVALRHDAAAFADLASSAWTRGLASAACLVASYGIALWAMTRAPIALVAALRETSVLFGAALAAGVLKERFGRGRWIAAGLIAAGAAAIRVS